ncbi:aldo/keto reductase [uncultured Tateyamaria sp.]|uniref:aldo/keto reductase n=1 Tax=uncultured Tateyamaria sp. TaxID=455651 RepID=UPI00261A9ED2|nr:aldo/keto reductase [uncultured Tateyamaria sp.]
MKKHDQVSVATEEITLWNDKQVPRIGIGTWVMGGMQYSGGKPIGWGEVDDNTSVRTLHTAFDMGVRIIDTSVSYGAGHAEDVIARAIRESSLDSDDVVICTKAGTLCDPESGDIMGPTDRKRDILDAIDASLHRLRTDYLDLVKFHVNRYPVDRSEEVFEALSEAYAAGKIAAFGWSNDDLQGAMAFADLEGFEAVQHDLNLFSTADHLLRAIEERGLWSFNRQPLAMGLLSGKYHGKSLSIQAGDMRSSGLDWMRYFDKDGAPTKDLVEAVEKVRALLTDDGRTVAQGALGWCLAQSDRTIPLPGCRTPEQAMDNFGVLALEPLETETETETVNAVNDFLAGLQRPVT